MPKLGCSTKLLVGILIVAVLLVVGLIFGALGVSVLGIEAPSWISVGRPHVELPAENVVEVAGFSITNTLIAVWITIIVLVALFYAATRKMKIIPGRLQSLAEGGIEVLLNFVEGVAGKENGRRFFPLIATIFLLVIFNAYLALIPIFGPGIVRTAHEEVSASTTGVIANVPVAQGDKVEEGDVIYVLANGEEITAPAAGEVEHLLSVGEQVTADEAVVSLKEEWPLLRSANTDLNLPLAIALMSFIFVEYWGMRAFGRRRYLTANFFKFGGLFHSIGQLFRGRIGAAFSGLVSGGIDAFVGMLELLSHFVRIISFTFRLFGNMTAGEILLLVVAFLVPWVIAVPFYGLEILVGFVQALIFAGLTLVFAVIAVAPHEEGEH